MSLSELYNRLSYEMSSLEKVILKNIKDTFQKLEPSNIHEYFYLYCYLLFNGYLSKDKYYEHNEAKTDEIVDRRIYDNYNIYSGTGVCSANSVLLQKIFTELSLDSKVLEIKLEDIIGDKLMDIKRNVGVCYPILNTDSCNHAVVFAKTKESNFILDSTNICELEVIKDKQIYYPNGSYLLDEELLKASLPNITYNQESTITNQMLLEYYRNIKKKCIENQKLLDCLYTENKENYKEISKKLEYFEL